MCTRALHFDVEPCKSPTHAEPLPIRAPGPGAIRQSRTSRLTPWMPGNSWYRFDAQRLDDARLLRTRCHEAGGDAIGERLASRKTRRAMSNRETAGPGAPSEHISGYQLLLDSASIRRAHARR